MEIANASPSEAAWLGNMKRLKELVLNQDPRTFLRWDVIKYTMFISNAHYISRELSYLKCRPDWSTRWRNAIKETFVGHPIPYKFNSSRSGNLIHHAYHVAQFEDKINSKVQDMDFVFEFGGGYGSMCRLFYNLGFRGRYVILDLPPFSALQVYFLKTAGMPVHSVDESVGSRTGVVCISDSEALKGILKNHNQATNKMFIATWSISETPISIRDKILPLVSDFQSFLIAYQDKFGEVDNLNFFDNWKEAINNVAWQSWRIDHTPRSNYLIGVRTNK